MLSWRKANTPPMNVMTNRARTSTRCLIENAISAFKRMGPDQTQCRIEMNGPTVTARLRAAPATSASGGLVHEQAAFGHNNFAGLQALQHLDLTAAGDARLDLPYFDGLIGARDPDARVVSLVDHRIARHRDRAVAFVGIDRDRSKHLRLELAAAVVDRRAHQQTANARIERRGHMVDVGLERRLRIGEHGEVELLPDTNLRRLAFANVSDEPHGREVTDREDRIDGAGAGVADVLTGSDLALHDG